MVSTGSAHALCVPLTHSLTHSLMLTHSLAHSLTHSLVPSVTGYPRFFHGKYLLNWAIFSAPRSAVFERTLANSVHIIFSEYFNEKVVFMAKHTPRFKLLLCTTMYVRTNP